MDVAAEEPRNAQRVRERRQFVPFIVLPFRSSKNLNISLSNILVGDPTEPLSPGHVEKLVSLQNSNIHGSSTAEECSALPYFQNLLAKEHPDIRIFHIIIYYDDI